MVDGLGFRYYWATEGLRDEDLAYKPSEEARTTSETIDHIYGLTKVIVNSTLKKPNSRADQEKLNQILIFPNPTKGTIHIEFTNPELIESLTIFSAWGRTIQTINPEDIRWGQIDLDLHPFGKGIYLIYIRQQNRVYYKRILVI